ADKLIEDALDAKGIEMVVDGLTFDQVDRNPKCLQDHRKFQNQGKQNRDVSLSLQLVPLNT
ncbi:hypothetical protein ACT4UM_21565, partial [Bacillus sp. SS-TM]